MSHLDMGIGGVTPLPVFDPLRERQPSWFTSTGVVYEVPDQF